MLFDLIYPRKLYNEISMFFYKTNFSQKVTIAELITLLALIVSFFVYYVNAKIGVVMITIVVIAFALYLKSLDIKMSNLIRELYEQIEYVVCDDV